MPSAPTILSIHIVLTPIPPHERTGLTALLTDSDGLQTFLVDLVAGALNDEDGTCVWDSAPRSYYDRHREVPQSRRIRLVLAQLTLLISDAPCHACRCVDREASRPRRAAATRRSRCRS